MSKQFNDREIIIFKYCLVAFLAGITIPLFILLIDFVLKDVPFTLPGFLSLYSINPIHYALLPSPLIFGVIAYLIGMPINKRFSRNEVIIGKEIEKTHRILDFTNKLIAGDENAEFEVSDTNDRLGNSLINLRDFLKENKEKEAERRREDEQRHWIAEGLAKFAEILRKDNDDIETLSYNIISNLVTYLSANQGGFFIIQEEGSGKSFQMSACYAYERRKYADKTLQWGEGLIGTAAAEGKTIYMTDVPDSYLHITSGLGKSNPRSLLIVPLKVNEEIHGVIEIASFTAFAPHFIDFVEKVAESIASTISSVKINVRTAKLLKESQHQAEVMAQQEEQMRQNMEELQATQEEAARQAEKFVSFTNSVNHTLIRAEYGTDGTLIYANTKFLKKLGYSSNSEVEGQNISMFINEKDKDWFLKIWENLSKGGRHFEGYMKHVTRQGQDLWTMATYTCVRREDGRVEKILFLAIDNTDQKKQSLDHEGQIHALNRSSIKVDYNTFGNILDFNETFLSTLKYMPTDLTEKSVFDFIEPEMQDNFRENWDNLAKGVAFQGAYLIRTKYSEERWLRCYFSPVYDMYGDVAKVVQISHDITKEHEMENEMKRQNDQLKMQEEKLRMAGEELSRKLEAAKAEMRQQFIEIERIKLRTEATLEGALDAIVTINADGRIEYFNKAAEELWQTTRNEILSKNISILFAPKNIENNDFLARFVQPGSNKIVGQRQEVTLTTKTGEDKNVLVLLSEAKVGKEHTYTAFVQNIEVELF